MSETSFKPVRPKTALVLSGGGSRGAYEAGAWQALTELGKKFDIVTGTSVGAINGAMVVQGDLDNTLRLWKEIETHMIFDVPEGFKMQDYAREFVKNKGVSTTGLKKLMEKYISEDVVRDSGVDFGVVVVELDSLTPRYVFKDAMKPGQIIDYIMASASIFPALHSYEIDGKEYIDGGYADVMPVKMAQERGADEIIAVYLNALGKVDRKALASVPGLTLIESKWDLGATLIFDTANARRIMRLGYLDTMKTYGVFDGEYYTFARGCFDKHTLKCADAAARIFELDPCLIYTHDSFLAALAQAAAACDEAADEMRVKYRIMVTGPSGTGRGSILGGQTPASLLRDLRSIANKRLLTLIAAENLRLKGEESVFHTRTATRLIPDVIAAAKFLNKFGLVSV